ncbi:hypothetical protein K502DRAFT_326036, partial [Neoconidiobolus thromboides FSU 785]
MISTKSSVINNVFDNTISPLIISGHNIKQPSLTIQIKKDVDHLIITSDFKTYYCFNGNNNNKLLIDSNKQILALMQCNLFHLIQGKYIIKMVNSNVKSSLKLSSKANHLSLLKKEYCLKYNKLALEWTYNSLSKEWRLSHNQISLVILKKMKNSNEFILITKLQWDINFFITLFLSISCIIED